MINLKIYDKITKEEKILTIVKVIIYFTIYKKQNTNDVNLVNYEQVCELLKQ